ncbi:MAG TPA: Hsp20/alpha crystallin family protein [Burkholderiales bacterium]|nr:Hsp20/alpha crystallin family protein [Burkholderiales bacterium]
MEQSANIVREPQAAEQPALVPPVDVIEDESGITLYADLPGVPRDGLDVHIDGEVLVIEGEMGLEMPKDMEATHVEVGLPRYRRVFTLSKELDPGRLQAEMKQGVLKLRIQKAERARPRRIEVSG